MIFMLCTAAGLLLANELLIAYETARLFERLNDAVPAIIKARRSGF